MTSGTLTRAIDRTAPARSPGLGARMWHYRWCYIFMLPSLILTAMFTFYPTVMSWYYSLLDWSGLGKNSRFIGLDNYRAIVHDGQFWAAFGRSFLFVLVVVPVQMIASLLIAIVLNDRALRLSPFFRAMFFLPVVTTAAIVGIVMTSVFSPFGGPLNAALLDLHLIDKPLDLLGHTGTSIWAVMGVTVWKNFGITMIYWLAALQTVPQTLYEAARSDGAGKFQLLRHITVPILLPFGAIILLLTANSTLHVFAIVQAMTAGGPFFSTQVMEVYIYQTAFTGGTSGAVPRLGYASAAGCLFGIAAMIVALLQVYVVRRVRGRNEVPR